MVIVEVINSLNKRGGAEAFFFNLCVALSQTDGVQVVPVSLFDEIHPSWKAAFQDRGLTLFCCGKKRGFDIRAAWRFKRIVQKKRPAIVHTHLSVINTYWLAFGFARLPWSLVHTVHNVANVDMQTTKKWILSKYVAKGLIHFVSISDQISNSLHSLLPKADSQTIYNGIPLRGGLGGKKKYDLVCPARMESQKNHPLLFLAFDAFCALHPERQFRLLCLGDGSKKAEYETMVASLPSHESIVFFGQTNDVYPFLMESKALILTSNYEGNPISILEGMDCGLPIIAPRIGGIPDVIEEGTNGFLFQPGDVQSAIGAIERWYSSGTNSTIGANNRNAVQRYHIVATAQEYIIFFKALARV